MVFFQAEDGIRDSSVTGVQTCALPIFPDVLQEKITVWRKARFGVFFQALVEPRINRPIGSIEGRSANTVAVLLQKGTHAIALLGRVALFKVRIAETAGEMMVIVNQRFGLPCVSLELCQCGCIAIWKWVTATADHVPGTVTCS